MKGYSIIVLIVFFFSCSNEIRLHNDSTDSVVCYCLLNLDSEFQFIRLDQTRKNTVLNNSAAFTANVKRFSNAEIYIEKLKNNTVEEVYYFNREEVLKQTDPASNPFLLYSAEFSIQPHTVYKLYVWLPNEGTMIFGETQTIEKPTILDPTPIPGRTIVFDNFQNYTSRFIPSRNSSIFLDGFTIKQGDLTINYSKNNILSFGSSDQIYNIFSGRGIVSQVHRQMNPNLNTEPFFLEYWNIVAGDELALTVSSADYTHSHFGSLNEFSNLTNAIGIFSSISETRISNLEFNTITLNSFVNETATTEKNNSGSVVFSFPKKRFQGIKPEKIHRIDLSLALTSDSLFRKEFIRAANTSDEVLEYKFTLPSGDYYYQAGITCTAQGDSCLWGGFPSGRLGSIWTSGQVTIIKDSTTIKNLVFK